MRQKRVVSFNLSSRVGSGSAVDHRTKTTRRSVSFYTSSTRRTLSSAESLDDYDDGPSSIGDRSELGTSSASSDASMEYDEEAAPLLLGDRVARSSKGVLIRHDDNTHHHQSTAYDYFRQWNRDQSHKNRATAEVAALLSAGPRCDGDTGSLRGFRKSAGRGDGGPVRTAKSFSSYLQQWPSSAILMEESPNRSLKPTRAGSLKQANEEFLRSFVPQELMPQMPQELMLQVLSRLSPRDMPSVGAVSRTMRSLERKFAAENCLLLLSPTPLQHSPIKLEHRLDTSKWPLLVKNSRPGLGTFVGAEPVSSYNTLFEVTVERMDGVGIDIGVAPAAAVTGGYLEKDKAWLFDCWGRARHGPSSFSYGAKVQPGDRVGVLYNAANDTLSFLLNGVSMGVAFSGLIGPTGPSKDPSSSLISSSSSSSSSGRHRHVLYPLVNLPFLPGEAVRISQAPCLPEPALAAGLGGLDALERSSATWSPPRHPDDNKLVVETLSKEAFRVELPLLEDDENSIERPRPTSITVSEAKKLIALEYGRCEPEQITLEVKGRPLGDESTLEEAGIDFCNNRTHLQKVYMYLDHISIA